MQSSKSTYQSVFPPISYFYLVDLKHSGNQAAPGRGINHEIQPEDNRYLIVHESSGFGPGDGHNLQAIRDFISYRTDPSRASDERLNVVW